MNKILIFTAAGFTASQEFADINTYSLTKLVREKIINDAKINNENPGEYFFKLLKEHYRNGEVSAINFETILHLIEELYAFQVSRLKDDSNKDFDPKFKGVKPSILKLKDMVQNDLEELGLPIYPHLARIYYHLLQEIIDELAPFALDNNNQGMLSFYLNFIQRYFPDDKYIKRVYSLNYDSWLNTHKGYYDGFNSSGEFDSPNVMNNFGKNCNYSLHGSVFWDFSTDGKRFHRINDVTGIANQSVSSDFPITREPIIPSPIISGYNKSHRLNYSPYSQLYYAFQTDLINCDKLIIIGYGFSDNHINSLFNNYNGKVFIVDYFDQNDPQKAESSSDILTNNVTREFYEEFDDDQILNSLINQNGLLQSKNNKIRIWFKGIGNEFYDKYDSLKLF